MPRPLPSAARSGAAVLLVLVGLIAALVTVLATGAEHRSYAGGSPQPSVHVTVGRTYTISVRGGLPALQQHGADVSSARCGWSVPGGERAHLSATVSDAGTKATTAVATFIAPYTGQITVDCVGWGAVYVDDADGASADIAGWGLLLTVLTFTLGLGLGLAALRGLLERRSGPGPAGEHDEVEAGVDVDRGGVEDGEVVGGDRGDVTA